MVGLGVDEPLRGGTGCLESGDVAAVDHGALGHRAVDSRKPLELPGFVFTEAEVLIAELDVDVLALAHGRTFRVLGLSVIGHVYLLRACVGGGRVDRGLELLVEPNGLSTPDALEMDSTETVLQGFGRRIAERPPEESACRLFLSCLRNARGGRLESGDERVTGTGDALDVVLLLERARDELHDVLAAELAARLDLRCDVALPEELAPFADL